MRRTRLVLVDDGHLQADVLAVRLRSVRDLDVVARVSLDDVPLSAQVERWNPDTILFDADVLDASVLSSVADIVNVYPSAHVVLLSSEDDPTLAVAAGRAGAAAWIDRRTAFDDLLVCVRGGAYFPPVELASVLRGVRADLRRSRSRSGPLDQLTAREREILHGIARGLNDRELAREFCISENTVRTHVGKVLSKLKVHSRLEAAGLLRNHLASELVP